MDIGGQAGRRAGGQGRRAVSRNDLISKSAINIRGRGEAGRPRVQSDEFHRVERLPACPPSRLPARFHIAKSGITLRCAEVK
jgi:hypothetical protein